MKNLQYIVVLLALIVSCSSPKKKNEGKKSVTESAMADGTPPAPENSESSGEGDEYKLVLKYIDNRVVVHMNDSIVYDSKTVYGAYNIEIFLTEYVNAGMTDLKVELYNGKPPYNIASPEWKVAYDIFINDQLVEFVAEGKKDGELGLVHTEEHDLSDIW